MLEENYLDFIIALITLIANIILIKVSTKRKKIAALAIVTGFLTIGAFFYFLRFIDPFFRILGNVFYLAGIVVMLLAGIIEENHVRQELKNKKNLKFLSFLSFILLPSSQVLFSLLSIIMIITMTILIIYLHLFLLKKSFLYLSICLTTSMGFSTVLFTLLSQFGIEGTWEISYVFNIIYVTILLISAIIAYFEQELFESIDQIKQTQVKLKQSEEKYRLLYENSLSGIAIHTLIYNDQHQPINYRIDDVNERFEKILPLKKTDVIDKTATEAYNVEEAPYLDVYAKVAQTGIAISFETFFESMNTTLKISVYPLDKNRFVTVFEDITDEMNAKNELIESEKKYREAYNRVEFYKDLLNHDINNILQVISIAIDVALLHLKNGEKNREVQEILEMIPKQIMRAANLINNIQIITELEDSQIPLKPIEIGSLLKRICSHFSSISREKKVNIEVNNPFDNITILANNLIQLVFENLLLNAVSHNLNRKVIISITVSKINNEGQGYLKLKFVDNARGITDTMKEVIFQRETINKKDTKGMGLGLSLVRKIVESYNGQVWVEDKVQGDYTQGSKFILLFPEIP